MATSRAAIIKIDAQLLLSMLQFKGGHVVRVFQQDVLYRDPHINLVVEHPDLPESEIGSHLRVVIPEYQTRYSKKGRILDIKRIDPPMGQK